MNNEQALADKVIDTLGLRGEYSELWLLIEEALVRPGDYVYVRGFHKNPTIAVHAQRGLKTKGIEHELSEPTNVITFPNRSRITFIERTTPGWMDRLRGLNVDGVVCVEPKPDTIQVELDILIPSLVVRDGWMIVSANGRHLRVR